MKSGIGEDRESDPLQISSLPVCSIVATVS